MLEDSSRIVTSNSPDRVLFLRVFPILTKSNNCQEERKTPDLILLLYVEFVGLCCLRVIVSSDLAELICYCGWPSCHFIDNELPHIQPRCHVIIFLWGATSAPCSLIFIKFYYNVACLTQSTCFNTTYLSKQLLKISLNKILFWYINCRGWHHRWNNETLSFFLGEPNILLD